MRGVVVSPHKCLAVLSLEVARVHRSKRRRMQSIEEKDDVLLKNRNIKGVRVQTSECDVPANIQGESSLLRFLVSDNIEGRDDIMTSPVKVKKEGYLPTPALRSQLGGVGMRRHKRKDAGRERDTRVNNRIE